VQMVGCTNTVKIHVMRELGDGETSLSNYAISGAFCRSFYPQTSEFRADAPMTSSGCIDAQNDSCSAKTCFMLSH